MTTIRPFADVNKCIVVPDELHAWAKKKATELDMSLTEFIVYLIKKERDSIDGEGDDPF